MRYENWKQLIGGRTGLLIIGAFIVLSIILVLTHIFDLPHLLLGAPRTPINLAEFVIDIVAAFFIGLIAIILIRQAELKRKKAEESLRESRDYLNNLINYANAPIIVWNSSYKITFSTMPSPF